jgi:DNA polymerase-3 subunit alpha
MYSLLNAVPTPKELAKAAKADGQDALAITDAGALYGAIDFYQACLAQDIKPSSVSTPSWLLALGLIKNQPTNPLTSRPPC